MVKIRLQRQGKKKAPFYHIVVADSKSPRDGKIIEQLGTYNPMTDPATIVLDKEKVEKWFSADQWFSFIENRMPPKNPNPSPLYPIRIVVHSIHWVL